MGEGLVSRAESRRQSHGDKEGTVLCTTELQGSSGGGRDKAGKASKTSGNRYGTG